MTVLEQYQEAREVIAFIAYAVILKILIQRYEKGN